MSTDSERIERIRSVVYNYERPYAGLSRPDVQFLLGLVTTLTTALRVTTDYLGGMPDAGLIESDPRRAWYMDSKLLRDTNNAVLDQLREAT